MKHLGIKEIQKIIPHRHPFLLVDYIEDYEPGEYAVGYKCVTYREDFFAGHFPQEPVMPGVLIVEALAQVGAVAVLMQEENKGKLGYFGGIKNCKFRRKVVPGDKLKLEARIIRQKGPLVIGEAVASVDGEVAVKAELSLMIGSDLYRTCTIFGKLFEYGADHQRDHRVGSRCDPSGIWFSF